MKKTFTFLLLSILSFSSCSGDDDTSDIVAGELTGPQFDMIIQVISPDFLSTQNAIVVNGTPTLNTMHWVDSDFNSGALIDENTTAVILIHDNVNDGWEFQITLYQHQDIITIGQPHITYSFQNDIALETGDEIWFTVGQDAEIAKFYLRHRNGNGELIKNIEFTPVIFN